MRSNLKKIILLMVIILIILFTIKLLKKEHQVTYNIGNYKIEENFYLQEKDHYYDFFIKEKDINYRYTLDEKAHKKKEIIKDIKTFKKDNLLCVIPIYKINTENKLYCNLNNKQVSTNYLIQTNNKSFKAIKKQAKKYNLTFPKTKVEKIKYKNMLLNQKNIPSNYSLIIWNYKGIDIITNTEKKEVKILNKDLYDNIMATTTTNYYVLFENQSVKGIKKIHYYDLKKDKLKEFQITEEISKDTYINGVIDDFIYLTDRRNKKQYKLNLKKKELEEVGNEEKKYKKYVNGKLKLLNISDFFLKDQFFTNEKLTVKGISSNDVKQNKKYYYYLKNNEFYQVYKNNLKQPILLFEMPKGTLKEWHVIENDILLLIDNQIYLYANETLSEILKNNELTYNYKNIYTIWKE